MNEDEAHEQIEISQISTDNLQTSDTYMRFHPSCRTYAPDDLNLNHVAAASSEVQLPEPDFQWGEVGNTFCNLISSTYGKVVH